MRNTITAFDGPKVKHALIDGLPVKGLPCPHTAIVKGDTKSFTIAAASIIAKVYRDALMDRWDEAIPNMGLPNTRATPHRPIARPSSIMAPVPSTAVPF